MHIIAVTTKHKFSHSFQSYSTEVDFITGSCSDNLFRIRRGNMILACSCDLNNTSMNEVSIEVVEVVVVPGLGAKRRTCFLGPFRAAGTVKSTAVTEALARMRDAASPAFIFFCTGLFRSQNALIMSQTFK